MSSTRVLQVPQKIFGEKTIKPVRNTLLEKHKYVKIGKSKCVEARPSIIHFGGYELQHVHVQKLRVLNVSSESKRIHIIPPSSPHFKVTYNKKGMVAPGMSEDLAIEFIPPEYKYFYDCIRIHSDEENLLVPIHAYPIMNEVIFPEHIDFGYVPVGETVRKTVTLECKVPIQFDFEISVLKSSSEFDIYPLSGIIPPDGSVDVLIDYHPSKAASAEMKVEVSVSQFGLEPIICNVVGSSATGMKRDQLLEERKKESLRNTKSLRTLTDVDNIESYESSLMLNKTGGGAGGGDPFTRHMSTVRKEKFKETGGKVELKMPKMPSPPPDRDVDGYVIPGSSLFSRSAVNDVLTQEKGKLRHKDIKRRMQKAEKTVANGEESRPQSRQMRELDFERELRAKEDFEISKQTKWFRCIGEDPMSEKDVQAVLDARKEQEEKRLLTEQRIDRERTVSELTDERVVVRRAEEFAEPEAEEPTQTEETEEGEVEAKRPSKEVEYKPSFTPEFKVKGGDAFISRHSLVQKFVNGARTLLVRKRVQRRLKSIANGLIAETEDTSSVRRHENADRRSVAPIDFGYNFDETEDFVLHPKPVYSDPSNIKSGIVPLYIDSNFQTSKPVPPPKTEKFKDWDTLTLKVPQEYKILGYEEEQIPPIDMYLEWEEDRPLMVGAEEEELFPRPAGEKIGEADLPVEHDLEVFEVAHPALVMNPFPNLVPYTTPLSFTETDPEYVLKAHKLRPESDHGGSKTDAQTSWTEPLQISRTEIAGTNSLFSMSKERTLSEMWTSSAVPQTVKKLALARAGSDNINEADLEQTLGGTLTSLTMKSVTGMQKKSAVDNPEIPHLLDAPRAEDELTDSDEEAQDEARRKGIDVKFPDVTWDTVADEFYVPGESRREGEEAVQPSESTEEASAYEVANMTLEKDRAVHRRKMKAQLKEKMKEVDSLIRHPTSKLSVRAKAQR